MADATRDAIQEMKVNFPENFRFISKKNTEVLLNSIIMGIMFNEY